MILSDFGGPGAHFLMIFEYFGCLGTPPDGFGHILSPRPGFLPKQSLPLRVPGGFSSDSMGGVLGECRPGGTSQTV